MNIVSKFILLIFVSIICGCKDKESSIVVPIEQIDTSGVYFQYNYLDSTYKGRLPLDITNENFYTSDSLKIKINNNNPSKFEFISIVKRSWSKVDEVISINNNARILHGYHDVDEKPLFFNVNDAYKNDSAIVRFFEGYYENSKNLKETGIYIVINGEGDAIYKSSEIQNKEVKKQVKEAINSMPKFTPPKNKGDTVSVVYLMEVPIAY